MKIDPYKHKESYFEWKKCAQNGIQGLCGADSQLIVQYLQDLEIGVNVSGSAPKGPRSFIHLDSLKDKLIPLIRKTRELYGIESITHITEEQVHLFFTNMLNGVILRRDGKRYKAVSDYVKIFKAFWHWYQRVQKKKGIEILDITADLDTRQEKPDWVYLTEDEVKTLAEKARYEYKVLMWFLFDTGIRAPTELMNVKVSDFYNDFKELQIREEVSKTFGRRIKLMICSDLIKAFIKEKELKSDDYVFTTQPYNVNKYFKRLSKSLFGDGKTPAGQRYCDLTLYDFRHISCCYWLPRYKSESALKYRFGWKKSDKIHYYSELLGMRDTITEDDLLIDVTKTQIEKELDLTRKRNDVLEDKQKTTDLQLVQIMELVKQLESRIKTESGGIYQHN